MKTEQKLAVSGALLVALCGGYYVMRQGKDKDAQAHTVTAAKDLPKIGVAKDKAAKATKLVVKSKDKEEVVLEKKGEHWRLSKPLDAAAQDSNVTSILDSLEKLELTTQIAGDADDKTLEKYELDDKNATHVQVYAGEDKLVDMLFGKSGSRGQTARKAGEKTVYAAKGYQSFLFQKETKNWRDTDVVKFEDANVVAVEVENKNGKFSFTKNGEKWGGSFYERDAKKGLAEKAAKWERFDEAKVKDLLIAYKQLKAVDFAKDKDDTGIDKAAEEGGVIRVKMKDGNGDFTVKVGKKQENDNRFLVKEGGDGTVYVVSSWSANWAVADKEKFSKPEEKKDDKKGDKKDKTEDALPMPHLDE
jgi:hypothetical protein